MAMVVKNNVEAQNSLNTLNKNSAALTKDLQKVSSGLKITGAVDDASGYAISERMEAQIRSLEQDNANAQNGGSLLKVAEGALQSTVDSLRILKEKAINAANDTNTDDDRLTIQKELNQMVDQLDENALVTYNGQYLINGSKNSSVVYGGTYTHLTNDGLGGLDPRGVYTPLLDITDTNGNSLNISMLDTVTVSYVKDGKTHVGSVRFDELSNPHALNFATLGHYLQPAEFQADFDRDIEVIDNNGDPTLIGTDQYGNEVRTIDERHGITFRAKEPGISGQIAGMTICISDHYGTPNKFANAIFDGFKESIPAQDQSEDNAVVLQVGTKSNQSVRIGMMDMRPRALGLRGSDSSVSSSETTLSIATRDHANAAINVLDNALQKALNQQTTIGSIHNRLEYTSANVVAAAENTQAAESVIRDADMAAAMTSYTKNNVLMQAAQSMLSQANQNSSQVLSLLQ